MPPPPPRTRRFDSRIVRSGASRVISLDSGLYDSVTARCRATLDSAVGATHDVAATVVHAYAARRNVLSDIGVLLPYFFAFVTVCWVAGGRTASRIDRDDWLATLLAVGGAIVVLGAAGAALGEIWSTVCEILRRGKRSI